MCVCVGGVGPRMFVGCEAFIFSPVIRFLLLEESKVDSGYNTIVQFSLLLYYGLPPSTALIAAAT